MSTHGAILNEEMLRALPSQVSKVAQGLLLMVGIASTGISIAGEWSHGNHYLNEWLLEHVTIVGSLLHLLLIVLVLFPGRVRVLNDELVDGTAKALIQCLNGFFLRAWTWFWVFLGLLYVVVLFMNMGTGNSQVIPSEGEAYSAAVRQTLLLDFFNGGSTLCMMLCYLFMTPSFLRRYTKRTTAAESRGPRIDPRKVTAWARFWIAVIGMSLLLGVVLYVRCRAVTLFPNPVNGDKLLSLSLGLASALSLAYFAGRMDSKFILNWQWVVVMLFLYAGMQIFTSVLYEDVQVNKAIFTYGAFTMKCVLFIFVSNFFESRRVIYYAYEHVSAESRTL